MELLPDVSRDPPMWMVQCKPGSEVEACVQLMRRFFERKNTDTVNYFLDEIQTVDILHKSLYSSSLLLPIQWNMWVRVVKVIYTSKLGNRPTLKR